MKLLLTTLLTILISIAAFSQTEKVHKHFNFLSEKPKGKIGFTIDSVSKKVLRVEIEGDTIAVFKQVFLELSKKDTVYVPVYLVDITDTVPATVMYKKSASSDRVYTVKGFALLRGFKTLANGKPQWADKPNIVGALDERKQPIKNVITIL